MGNTQSQKQHEFLYPSASLAYKVGTKNEGIPYPAAGRAAIDKLVLTPEFKNYVLSHLDDEHLMIMSIDRREDSRFRQVSIK